jgi:hypothetical protein
MEAMQLEQIIGRIEQLERSRRRVIVILIVCLTSLFLLNFCFPQWIASWNSITVQDLVLSRDGRIYGLLGIVGASAMDFEGDPNAAVPFLIFRDGNSQDRMRLGLGPDGSPVIELMNKAGEVTWRVSDRERPTEK